MVQDIDHGSVHLYVTNLSRVFRCKQHPEQILKDICDNFLELTAIPRIAEPDPCAFFICDPKCWGSAEPCRIVVLGITPWNEEVWTHGVQGHRLYLKENDDGSNLVLTYEGSSRRVPLESQSENRWKAPTITSPSTSGRCIVSYYSLGSRYTAGQHGEFNIMVSQLWKDDVHLYPSGYDRYDGRQRLPETDHYIGTQIWYLKDGSCVLRFFD